MIKYLMAASLLLAGCSSEEQTISAPSPDLPDKPATAAPLSLYTFDCGSIEISDLDAFSSTGDYAGQTDKFTNTCYLIRHPQGDLLWDLGLPHSLAGAGPQSQDIFTISLERTLTEQLAEIGLSAQDIEFISISHSHFDHSGQAALFPDSQWLVNRDEFDYMFSTDANKAQNVAFTDLNKSIHSGNHDVFGDGSVMILELPGHTPGHSALQVNLVESGPILLTGDLYHRSESRELKRVPRFNSDEAQTRESMEAFETLARESGARVIIQHEPADVATLPKSPAFLQ
ncbi:N-acyl homoserine lactonase family protein [Porticoccaceae bacterium]|nr:N-acyl homoserine lactonase family protein [Porticoccaceae bacterium]MDB9805389.1 N-acyl homoserine lactonase family protein [Porticoccaceae bacterium]MDB9948391.1 N-acyl homoserine lactonase family protein [Porticoccaceae bacterium]